MATKYKIRECKAEDLVSIALAMREKDVIEISRLDGRSIMDALTHSYIESDECWVAENGNGPFAVWGIGKCSLIGFAAIPWMLATPEIEKYKKSMVKISRLMVRNWKDRYDTLFNYVDAEYEETVRWAGRIGFEVTGPFPHRNGFMAYRIEAR